MRVIDIITESLRAMGDNFDNDIMSLTTYAELSEDFKYKDRVINMLPVINRGLMRAYQLNGVLSKTIEVTPDMRIGKFINLSKIPNFASLVGVFDVDGSAMPYEVMGDNIIGAGLDIIVYMPQLKIIIATTEDYEKDVSEFGIHSTLAKALPLYVKSELFQQDDPNIAKSSREDFDAIVSRPPAEKPKVQSSAQVKLVYSCNG